MTRTLASARRASGNPSGFSKATNPSISFGREHVEALTARFKGGRLSVLDEGGRRSPASARHHAALAGRGAERTFVSPGYRIAIQPWALGYGAVLTSVLGTHRSMNGRRCQFAPARFRSSKLTIRPAMALAATV